MEAYAGAALTSLGYMLSEQRDAMYAPSLNVPRNMPSMENMYQSSYVESARKQEAAAAKASWDASQRPMQTGVVPRPAFANMFAEVGGDMGISMGNGMGSAQSQSLTGNAMNREDFTHNNMQPFFRGALKQNVNVENTGMLERHTGRSEHFKQKNEVECFFKPEANTGNVCGMPAMTNFYSSRIVAPITRNNEFPLEQERVGPGLNAGYGTSGTGGFHQANTLDYARPKMVDELRAANNPKLSYDMPVQGPSKGTTQRGQFSEMTKNRPDTFYEQTPDRWLGDKAAITAPTQRPDQLVKPTSRVQTSVEYEGVANAVGQPGRGKDDDYGKSTICVFDNARTQTVTKTVVSNFRADVKAAMAPLLGALRRAPKEYLIDAPRQFGNMSIQIPSKPTLVDPVNHAPKTTIKETTIHDTDVSNLHGPARGPVMAEQDARTTTRETLPCDVTNTVRNVAQTTYRVRVYNVDEIARRTHRETTSDAKNIAGNVGRQENALGGYVTTTISAPLTQKAFTSATSHYGSAGSRVDFKGVNLEAVNNMRVDGTREMLLRKAAYTPNAKGANEGRDAADMNMNIRRSVIDDMAPRTTHNVTRIQEASTKRVDACELTKPANELPYGSQARLDPSVLSSLKTNPFQININPIVECA